MNKAMLPRMLWQRVRVWPLPGRVRTDGLVLPRMDDDWIPVSFDAREGVRRPGADRGGRRLWDGLKHGRLRLRVQLTLSGCNLYKRRLPRLHSRRRKTH